MPHYTRTHTPFEGLELRPQPGDVVSLRAGMPMRGNLTCHGGGRLFLATFDPPRPVGMSRGNKPPRVDVCLHKIECMGRQLNNGPVYEAVDPQDGLEVFRGQLFQFDEADVRFKGLHRGLVVLLAGARLFAWHVFLDGHTQ